MNAIIKKGNLKGTIVYIHGNSSSSKVFEKILKSTSIKLSQIAMNLPGHKLSSKNLGDEEAYSNKSYCDNLISIINKIDDDVILVGNSLGGHLAIEISNHINTLKALVICGAPPVKKPINFEEAFMLVPELHTFLTESPSQDEIIAAANLTVFNKTFAQQIISDFNATDPKVRAMLAKDLSENNWNDQKQLFINLKVPKFIIMGSHDPSVNPSYLIDIKNKCNGDCEIIPFNECGHYPSLEKPDAFIKAINHVALQVFNH